MTKIAMQRMFDNIAETENTANTMSINDIENALCQNYKSCEELTERYYAEKISENQYDMSSEALWEEEEMLKEAIKRIYPYAFNEGEMMDNDVYECIHINLEQNHMIRPEDILEATALSDDDAKYLCKIRSFHNGKFINNNVIIYMDKDYTNREKVFAEDYNNTCSAIAYGLGHEFVAVVDIKKI